MHERNTIQNLVKYGWKKKDIAEQIGCHRNTILNIIKENLVKEKIKQVNRQHSLDMHREYIEELLNAKLSLVRIHEELVKQKGYEKTYDVLRKYAKSRKLQPAKVYTVLHADPGEEAQVDFGYVGKTSDDTGQNRKTYVFACILSFSRKGFFKTVYNQKVETFIDCHKEAFEYFGGVPERVKTDNLKAAVLEAHFYEPVYQKMYQAFSEYYGFVPLACKVRYPEEKGKVESGIKYVKNNFFNGRTFQNGADLRQQLWEWQETVCNQRIHGTTRKIPEKVFLEEEKNKLKPLPEKGWEIYRYERRKVADNCHILIDRNYYSVPYKYVGENVEIRIGKNIFKIYFHNEQVAIHPRKEGEGMYQTNPVHYPEYKRINQTEYQFKQGERMKNIGEHAYQYFLALKKRYPDEWGKKVRGILQLEKHYGQAAINQSCRRAIVYQSYSYHAIANICRKGLFQEEIEDQILAPVSRKTDWLERPLSYYSHIFISLILTLWNILITHSGF